jgi:hypothetical protein
MEQQSKLKSASSSAMRATIAGGTITTVVWTANTYV